MVNTQMTHIMRYGERVDGCVYDLTRFAHVRETRLHAGRSANVWLGDNIAGTIRRERVHHRGRECWRWVGHHNNGAPIPDATSMDRLTTARAVATAWLEERAGLPDYESDNASRKPVELSKERNAAIETTTEPMTNETREHLDALKRIITKSGARKPVKE